MEQCPGEEYHRVRLKFPEGWQHITHKPGKGLLSLLWGGYRFLVFHVIEVDDIRPPPVDIPASDLTTSPSGLHNKPVGKDERVLRPTAISLELTKQGDKLIIILKLIPAVEELGARMGSGLTDFQHEVTFLIASHKHVSPIAKGGLADTTRHHYLQVPRDAKPQGTILFPEEQRGSLFGIIPGVSFCHKVLDYLIHLAIFGQEICPAEKQGQIPSVHPGEGFIEPVGKDGGEELGRVKIELSSQIPLGFFIKLCGHLSSFYI